MEVHLHRRTVYVVEYGPVGVRRTHIRYCQGGVREKLQRSAQAQGFAFDLQASVRLNFRLCLQYHNMVSGSLMSVIWWYLATIDSLNELLKLYCIIAGGPCPLKLICSNNSKLFFLSHWCYFCSPTDLLNFLNKWKRLWSCLLADDTASWSYWKSYDTVVYLVRWCSSYDAALSFTIIQLVDDSIG